MTDDTRSLTGVVAFISTLVAVVLLSKIGGTGADLAIMTGLIGVLGMLAPGLVPSRGADRGKVKEEEHRPSGKPDDPVSVEEVHP